MVSVIIVTFNNERTIRSCLGSVLRGLRGRKTNVIVVDNNSDDATVSLVEKYLPQVAVIENKQNFGFAAANNQATQRVKSKFVLLLNPDAEVKGNALEEMVAYMEKHNDVGILGPKLLNAGGKVQKEISPFPGLLSMILILLKLHRIAPFKSLVYPNYDYDKIQESEHLMGSALLIRKEVFDKIGLFDEKFFLWFEETDLEKRAKEAGFKVVYYPKAVVKHLVGQSTKQIHPMKRQAIWNQSLRYYFQKHKSALEQTVLVPFIIVSYAPVFLMLLKEKLVNR